MCFMMKAVCCVQFLKFSELKCMISWWAFFEIIVEWNEVTVGACNEVCCAESHHSQGHWYVSLL